MLNQNLNQIGRKKHNRVSVSDFEFLIQSMDKGKQNINENCLQSLKNSHNGIYSKQNAQQQKIQTSRVPLIQSICHPNDIYEIVQKTNKFLKLADTLLETCADGKLLRQAKSLSQNLHTAIQIYTRQSQKGLLRNPIKESYQDSNNYMKIITDLEEQKDKLLNLVSQHQRANIKMYIKINQGQSQQIQKYKKQLSSLFESYKKLEKIILSKSHKIHTLQEICLMLKNQLQQKNNKIKKIQSQLDKIYKQYKILNQKNNKKLQNHNHQELFKLKQCQQIINQQNNQLQRLYQEIKKMIQQKKQYHKKQQQLNNKVEKLQKKIQFNKLIIKSQLDQDYRTNQYYNMLIVQADAIEELIGSLQ